MPTRVEVPVPGGAVVDRHGIRGHARRPRRARSRRPTGAPDRHASRRGQRLPAGREGGHRRRPRPAVATTDRDGRPRTVRPGAGAHRRARLRRAGARVPVAGPGERAHGAGRPRRRGGRGLPGGRVHRARARRAARPGRHRAAAAADGHLPGRRGPARPPALRDRPAHGRVGGLRRLAGGRTGGGGRGGARPPQRRRAAVRRRRRDPRAAARRRGGRAARPGLRAGGDRRARRRRRRARVVDPGQSAGAHRPPGHRLARLPLHAPDPARWDRRRAGAHGALPGGRRTELSTVARALREDPCRASPVYSRRSTATTRPSTVASSPGMGS